MNYNYQNNNRLFFRVLIFCGFISLLGCEDKLKVDLDYREPRLVVNSMFCPDNDMMVHVSHSLGISTAGSLNSIGVANVQITDQNGTKTKLNHIENGFYSLENFRPLSKSNYQISIDCPGYKTVTSSNYVPSQVVATYQDSTSSYFRQVKVLNVELQVEDNPIERNYYILEAYREVLVEIDEVNYLQRYQLSVFSSDKLSEHDLFDSGVMQQRIYLPDSDFADSKHNIRLAVELIMEDEGGILCIEVKSVSQELYNYLKSLDLYNTYGDDSSLSSPVQVSNNINSGFGIFGGYTSHSIIFDMSKEGLKSTPHSPMIQGTPVKPVQ